MSVHTKVQILLRLNREISNDNVLADSEKLLLNCLFLRTVAFFLNLFYRLVFSLYVWVGFQSIRMQLSIS